MGYSTSDTYNGLDGDDTIWGGTGNDVLNGDAGDDILIVDTGDNYVNGGSGYDAVSYEQATSGVTVDLAFVGYQYVGSNQGSDYLTSIEAILGSQWNDVLKGDSSGNEILGRNGNDILYGRHGGDALLGGDGNDTLFGDDIAPSLHFEVANFDHEGDGYAEKTYYAFGNYMAGGAGDDTYYVMNYAYGADFSVSYVWGYVNNVETQIVAVEQVDDIVEENANEGSADLVWAGVDGYVLTANVENLQLLETADVAPADALSVLQIIRGSGNELNNRITGNAGGNILFGELGNDTLLGAAGNDTLDGGAGSDSLSGGTGNDVYIVDSLSDTVGGEAATVGEIDRVESSVTWTLTENNIENVTLTGSAAINATGNSLNNVLNGNGADNSLTGAGGNDTLFGYDGDDTLLGGASNDVLDGGNGNNTASYADISAAVTVSLATDNAQITGGAGTDTLILIQNLAGGSGNDSLTGNANNNILTGNGGADTLLGGDGDDTYYLDNTGDNVVETAAGGSNDRIYSTVHYTLANRYVESLTLTGSAAINGTGNNMANSLTGNSGINILDAKEGNDTVNGGDGDDTVYGTVGDDVLSGGNGINTLTYTDISTAVTVKLDTSLQQNTGGGGLDTITQFSNVTGGSGNDTLTGNGSANRIDGGLGNDSMVGGAGGDTYVVNSLGDSVVEASVVVGEIDTVQSTVTWTLGANLENLLLNGTAAADGYGNGGHNTLTGNAWANTLSGLDGNDSLLGGDGDDTLLGGQGNDNLNGGNGINTVSYEGTSAAVTVSLLSQGVAQATGGAGSDTLTLINNLMGGDGNDSLTGDATANRLGGGAGVDTVSGGLGNDTYLVGGNGDVIVETSTLVTERDTVESSGTFTLAAIANVENITLTGTALSNATGNSLANVLTGNAAANVLDGGTGADSMLGGGGNDTYYVDAVGDLITEAGPATDIDTVYTAVTWTLGNNLEILNLTASSSINGTGNALNNTLNGNNGNNVLEGGLGNDSLFGGNGIDSASYLGATAAVNVSLALSNTSQNTGAAGFDYLNLIENLQGSNFNDTLFGDGYSNTLHGLSGNDSLSGNGGNDTLYGNDGNDTLLGGDGSDYLSGGAGNDSIDGGIGVDGVSYADATSAVTVSLALPSGQITGGSGTDTLSGIEHLTGSSYNDVLSGSTDANSINGSAGNDSLFGNDNNDTLNGGAGNDSLNGGNGIDTANYGDATAAVKVSLLLGSQDTGGSGIDVLSFLENVTGSAYADSLTGDNNNNVLSGLGGDDSLQGGVGNDTLAGGVGADRLDGGTGINTASYADITAAVSVNLSIVGGQNTGAGGTDTLLLIHNLIGSGYNDTLQGDVQANVLEGGAGNDSLFGADGVDTLNGGAGDDILDGGGNTNTVSYAGTSGNLVVNVGNNLQQDTGAAGLDTLLNMHNIIGGNGNDSLTGGSGNTTLEGGLGNDSLFGGGGINTASYASATAGVNVSLLLSNASQNTGAAGWDWLNQINYLQGSGFNDNLTGDDSWNVLRGGAGNDVLTDALGNDGLYGEDGNDTLIGGTGDDIIDGGAGTNTASYLTSTVAVTVSLQAQGVGQVTGAGTDTLTLIQNLIGGTGNDTLTGNDGANVLNGATGVDSMVGGLGADTYYVDNDNDVIVELSSDASVDLVYSSAAIFNMGGRYVENVIMTGIGSYSVLGNGLANDITGNAGANIIRGGIANDTVRGGLGNDTYQFRRDYDIDTIIENDSTANNTDIVEMTQADVAVDQLWFQHVGNDLEMSIIGTDDKVIIKDWYSAGTATEVEEFHTFDGQVLLAAQVDALVSAMAGVSATVPTGTTLTVDQQAALAAIIDSSWN